MPSDHAPHPRWTDVTRLFDAALDVAPADRTAWLAALDADAEVVAELRSLLEWHEGSGTFLETPAVRVPDLADMSMVGRALGPWRLVDVIGRGGMGVVYKVEHVRMGMVVPAKRESEGLGTTAVDPRKS